MQDRALPAPGVDYAEPLAEQPWAADPHVLWYDSFDAPDAAARYLGFETAGGRMQQVFDVALGGAGGSIRARFGAGTVNAGAIRLALGDWPAGGRAVAHAGQRFDEIHWRVYVRHQAGWVGNPGKLSRAIAMADAHWAEGAIAHVWGADQRATSQEDGTGVLTLDPATGIDAAGRLAATKYNDFANLRWLGNRPSGTSPLFSTREGGRWVAVEAAAVLNTPGRADGTFALWVDGRLDAQRSGLDWHGTWAERGFNAVFLENWWNAGSPVAQERWFDDFVVSTRPIGLARTDRNPTIVKVAFAQCVAGGTQSAWQAQVGTATGGPSLVWDSGTMGDSGDRVRIDAAHGAFSGELTGRRELAPGAPYAVRVRQRDERDRWSEWSRWRTVIQTASC